MNPLTILIVIACYFALLFFISYLAGRKADNAGFFSGNRSSNWLLVAMSTIGAAISGVILLVSAIICKIAHKTDNDDFMFFMTLITVFATVIFIVVFSTQLFDIIECLTIPEKTIIEYISMLLRQK